MELFILQYQNMFNKLKLVVIMNYHFLKLSPLEKSALSLPTYHIMCSILRANHPDLCQLFPIQTHAIPLSEWKSDHHLQTLQHVLS